MVDKPFVQQELMRRAAAQHLKEMGRGELKPDEIALGGEGLKAVKAAHDAWIADQMNAEERASLVYTERTMQKDQGPKR